MKKIDYTITEEQKNIFLKKYDFDNEIWQFFLSDSDFANKIALDDINDEYINILIEKYTIEYYKLIENNELMIEYLIGPFLFGTNIQPSISGFKFISAFYEGKLIKFYYKSDVIDFKIGRTSIEKIEDLFKCKDRSIIEKMFDKFNVMTIKIGKDVFYNIFEVNRVRLLCNKEYIKYIQNDNWVDGFKLAKELGISHSYCKKVIVDLDGEIIEDSINGGVVEGFIHKNKVTLFETKYCKLGDIISNWNITEEQLNRLIQRNNLEQYLLGISPEEFYEEMDLELYIEINPIKDAINEYNKEYYLYKNDSNWIDAVAVVDILGIPMSEIQAINMLNKKQVNYLNALKSKVVFIEKRSITLFKEKYKLDKYICSELMISNELLKKLVRKCKIKGIQARESIYAVFYNYEEVKNALNEYNKEYYLYKNDPEWSESKEVLDKLGIRDNIIINEIDNIKVNKVDGSEYFYRRKVVDKFVNNNITYGELIQNFNVNKFLLNYLDEKYNIKAFSIGKRYSHFFYIKDKSIKVIKEFFEKYTLKKEVFEEFREFMNDKNIHMNTFSGYLRQCKVEVIHFNWETEYIPKNSLDVVINYCKNIDESFTIYAKEKGYYNLIQTMKILNLPESTLYNMIDVKELIVEEVYHKAVFFKKDYIDSLKDEQQEKLRHFQENYMSKSEARKLFGAKFTNYINTYKTDFKGELQEMEIPKLIRGFYKGSDRTLFDKKQLEYISDRYKKDCLLKTITLEDKFKEFVTKVEDILKVEFSEKQIHTKKMWYEFIEKKIINSPKNNKRMTWEVNTFARNTEYIFSIFTNEIYTYSENEINNRYLNENSKIERSYQKEFYSFLKILNNTVADKKMVVLYNFSELNNPKDYERIKNQDMTRYTLDEYQSLYLYCNDVGIHKNLAIHDAEQYILTGNDKEYRKYASVWLYVMVHLFNNWRHGTVCSEISDIDLTRTGIKSLDWLKNNNPTIEDANILISQINRKKLFVSKTKVETEKYFTIGEPMKIAFATAISICKFRNDALNVMETQKLIDFSTQLYVDGLPYRKFFESFNGNVEFKNRKMNRTVMSLIEQITDYFNDNYYNNDIGIETSKQSRNHKNINSTKTYIKLEDSQIEELVLEIFERNNFGFISKHLADTIMGHQSDRQLETRNIKLINIAFGDVDKIEVSMGLLNDISIRQQEVRQYIAKMKFDEVNKLYLKSLVGKLPSRKKYYQCVFSKCKYIDKNNYQERDCENCEGAICNVYALTELANTYIENLEYLAINFEKAILGEKKKMVNQFYLLHKRINEARKMFGKEVINNFIDGGQERLKKVSKMLSEPELRKYRTVKENANEKNN